MLTRDEVERFVSDGFVCLPEAFPRALGTPRDDDEVGYLRSELSDVDAVNTFGPRDGRHAMPWA